MTIFLSWSSMPAILTIMIDAWMRLCFTEKSHYWRRSHPTPPRHPSRRKRWKSPSSPALGDWYRKHDPLSARPRKKKKTKISLLQHHKLSLRFRSELFFFFFKRTRFFFLTYFFVIFHKNVGSRSTESEIETPFILKPILFLGRRRRRRRRRKKICYLLCGFRRSRIISRGRTSLSPRTLPSEKKANRRIRPRSFATRTLKYKIKILKSPEDSDFTKNKYVPTYRSAQSGTHGHGVCHEASPSLTVRQISCGFPRSTRGTTTPLPSLGVLRH